MADRAAHYHRLSVALSTFGSDPCSRSLHAPTNGTEGSALGTTNRLEHVLTPPTDLSDSDLEEVIGHAWGVPVASLEYHAVGFGSHHWVATDNQGLRHFVTVDELSSESHFGDEVSALGFHLRRALEAATDLRTFGCSFVVAPITTKADEPFFQFSGYSVALYPFIEGRSFSFEEPFGEADRDHVLAVVLALHQVPISAIRPPETEGFVVPWLDQLDRSMHHGSEGGKPKGPYARDCCSTPRRQRNSH